MAKDVVSLWNLALSSVGTKARVSSVSESSREAGTCGLWYDIARDSVLRAAYWPSCRSHRRLALLAERDTTLDWDNDDPSPKWLYAYSLPADYIGARHLSTYAPFTMDVYRPTGGPDQTALMTNQPEALLYYTYRRDQPQAWDDSLYLAVAYALASHIAMPLHGKSNRMADSVNRANALIMEARAAVANSEEDEVDTIPPWIEARGYGESGPRTRFFYPYGPLLSVSTEPVPSA